MKAKVIIIGFCFLWIVGVLFGHPYMGSKHHSSSSYTTTTTTKKKSSTNNTSSSYIPYSESAYDKGYKDYEDEEDWDDERYDNDQAYADGVDAALEEYGED